jgi:hypothetical protein
MNGYLYKFLTHFFLHPSRWQYRLSLPRSGVILRSLLHPDTGLDHDANGRFDLKDVFTRKKRYKVGGWTAGDLLMLHGIANLYVEGLIPPNCWFTTYPGHEVGTTNEVVASFLRPAAKFFHGFFKTDLLIRSRNAPDTSLLRFNGGTPKFSDQVMTVHVNPSYRDKITGKTVVLFDDFTTDGMSLEWGRLLLRAAGASRVICMTVGKYPGQHRVYQPGGGFIIRPYELNDCEDDDFAYLGHSATTDGDGRDVTVRMFECWANGEPYSRAK